MSRIEIEAVEPFSYDILAQQLQQDDELQQLLKDKSNSSLQIKKINEFQGNNPIHCDISQSTIRPFITRTLRKEIFNKIHNIAHPGANATIDLITKRFVWPGMKKDIRN